MQGIHLCRTLQNSLCFVGTLNNVLINKEY